MLILIVVCIFDYMFYCVHSASTVDNVFDFEKTSKPEHQNKVNDKATKADEITVILKRQGSISEDAEL